MREDNAPIRSRFDTTGAANRKALTLEWVGAPVVDEKGSHATRSCASRESCPGRIRTFTSGSKGRCAAITPPGKMAGVWRAPTGPVQRAGRNAKYALQAANVNGRPGGGFVAGPVKRSLRKRFIARRIDGFVLPPFVDLRVVDLRRWAAMNRAVAQHAVAQHTEAVFCCVAPRRYDTFP